MTVHKLKCNLNSQYFLVFDTHIWIDCPFNGLIAQTTARVCAVPEDVTLQDYVEECIQL